MIIWLDVQLSPALALWMKVTFKVETHALRDLGLRDATDAEIFEKARLVNATIMTKDSYFVQLHHTSGAPPQIIWLTCGNTSNKFLQTLLISALPKVFTLLQNGEGLVEVND